MPSIFWLSLFLLPYICRQVNHQLNLTTSQINIPFIWSIICNNIRDLLQSHHLYLVFKSAPDDQKTETDLIKTAIHNPIIMLKADETLDFHNKQIAEVALGERCPNKDKSCAYILTSPLGHVYTNACSKGLHCVKLYGDTSYDDINWDTKVDFIRASSLMPSNPHSKQLKKWLQMYFSNPIKCKGIDIEFCGLEEYGEFNSKVWMTILNTCPPGDLMSYSELAQRSGYGAGASKVVGYAINKNPYMLVVGDHRVVKASGEIWCENESQRNKLRRLLVYYEVEKAGQTLDEALLIVKERNEASKGSRKRASSTKAKAKSEPKVKTESNSRKKSSTGGVKKTAASKKGAKKKAPRRKKLDDSDEESDEEDDSFIDDEEED